MRPILTYLAKFKRLHWATWTVLLFTLLALLLIMVPGEYQAGGFILPVTDWEQTCYQLCIDARGTRQRAAEKESQSPGSYIYTHAAAFSHGWPRPFLVRALIYDYRRSQSKPWLGKKSPFASWGGSLHHNVSWSNYDNWPLSADGWLLRPWSLLLDILIATIVLVTAGGLVQWRIQSNGGLLRFKLADMLAIVTLIGIGLGTFLYHDTLRRREAFDGKPIAAPAFRSPDGWITYGQSYQGPNWLRKLAGNPYYLLLFHHVDRATVTVDNRWRENFTRLREYPYLETLTTLHGLPVDAIPLLRDCPQLEEIHLGMYELDTPLLVPGTKDRTLQPDDFSQLGELRLSRAYVCGVMVQKQHIAALAEIPTMRHIQIQSTSVTEKQIAELRDEYPHVTIQELPEIPVILSPG